MDKYVYLSRGRVAALEGDAAWLLMRARGLGDYQRGDNVKWLRQALGSSLTAYMRAMKHSLDRYLDTISEAKRYGLMPASTAATIARRVRRAWREHQEVTSSAWFAFRASDMDAEAHHAWLSATHRAWRKYRAALLKADRYLLRMRRATMDRSNRGDK